jgi:HPt (histidine-containing phosphotransfer) domain-containing protein
MGSSPAAAAQPEPAATQQAQADGGAIKSQFADDPEMSELIEAFVARLPETADAMAQALSNNCFDELRRLAHQLKGSGGGYGYPSLTQQASKLEDSARAADGEAARLALDELKATVRAAVAGRDAGAAMKGEKR